MTTTHTPGRITMRENGEANSYALITEDNQWLLSLLHNGQQVSDQQRANLRRLAACWNAFEGVNTEAIEELGPMAGVISDPAQTRIFELEAERDTLLQHLQACVTGWQKGDDVAGPMHSAMALLTHHHAITTRIRQDIARGARQSNGKLPG